MTLAPGLRGVLTIIVDGLLEGTLSPRTDYGTFPYRTSLTSNSGNDAEAVRDFLNEKVQLLTQGRLSVVFADGKYFSTSTNSGLRFACVPAGQNDSSRDAQYFGVAGGSNGVYFAERASDEQIAASERHAAEYARRRAQSSAGEKYADGILGMIRSCAVQTLADRWDSLSAQQRSDIDYAIGVYQRDSSAIPALERLATVDLKRLCAILVILGFDELPHF